MITVTLIGFGNVGASLSLLLLNNRHHIRLNVMEPSQQTEGALLDLAHSMSLYPTKELNINDETLFLSSDFIFYTAGTPNEHGGSRLSKAKENIQLCKEIFSPRTFTNKPYIIVISNPVDIISHAVYQFSGLAANQVVGTGTFLDSIRLSYYLSKLSSTPVSDFETWVLGEHGSSQVPIFSMSKRKGKALMNQSVFTSKELEHAAELTKDAAYHIRKTQTGTKYGVAKCASILFDYLLGDKEQVLPLSMLTNDYYRSLLQLNRNIYISLPVKVKNGSLANNNEINLSVMELQALRQSAALIADLMY